MQKLTDLEKVIQKSAMTEKNKSLPRLQVRILRDVEIYISGHIAALGFPPSAIEVDKVSFEKILRESPWFKHEKPDIERFRYKDVLIVRSTEDCEP